MTKPQPQVLAAAETRFWPLYNELCNPKEGCAMDSQTTAYL
jgi:hypothetical protein